MSLTSAFSVSNPTYRIEKESNISQYKAMISHWHCCWYEHVVSQLRYSPQSITVSTHALFCCSGTTSTTHYMSFVTCEAATITFHGFRVSIKFFTNTGTHIPFSSFSFLSNLACMLLSSYSPSQSFYLCALFIDYIYIYWSCVTVAKDVTNQIGAEMWLSLCNHSHHHTSPEKNCLSV